MQSLRTAINRKRFRRGILIGVILAVALLLIAYGVLGFWQWYQATHDSNPTIPTEVVTVSTASPSETPPTQACLDYKTADTQPRLIEIPSIGASGCVQRVGVDQDNNIAVPTNIHVAGWYVNSPSPGEEGVSLIDGHVLGRYADAIFVKLEDLKANDMVRVQRGDMSWLEFTVVDVARYPVEEVMGHLFQPLDGVKSQLTLITCTGTFDSHSQTYDERVVVRAQLTSAE